jgi:hypothetical protein
LHFHTTPEKSGVPSHPVLSVRIRRLQGQ